MLSHQKASGYTSIVIFLVTIASIGLAIPRHETFDLMLAYFSAFFCYMWMIRMNHAPQLLFATGVIARLVFFFHLPSLSDDFYRFLWDGQLIANGISPYLYTPQEMLGNQAFNQDLLSLLNSPSYFSIYPPLNQGLFWLAAESSNGNYLFGVNTLRLVLLLTEVGSFLLLKSVTGNKSAFFYFLNPLVILEIVGNIHFEGLVIFFLLLFFYAIKKKKYVLSGLSVGLAAATKLIPLILIPAIFLKYRWKKGVIISSIAIGSFSLFFVFLDQQAIYGMWESIQLYFKKFEFNASVYFLLREIGFILKGYNIIHTLGPWLLVSSIFSILLISITGALKKWNLSVILLLVLSTYYLFTTTVHPWYILTLLPLGLMGGYYFPIAWTFLVFITYGGYSENGYNLSMGWVVTEYIVLIGFVVSEMYYKKYLVRNE